MGLECILSKRQARQLAQAVYMDIEKYVRDHQEEFEMFLKELEQEKKREEEEPKT